MKQRYNPADHEVCSRQPKWAVNFGGIYCFWSTSYRFNHYLSGFKPDVYFKPQEVWEIRGAESVTLHFLM